jgi:hypothetical protein
MAKKTIQAAIRMAMWPWSRAGLRVCAVKANYIINAPCTVQAISREINPAAAAGVSRTMMRGHFGWFYNHQSH